jgi:hypothetical protein
MVKRIDNLTDEQRATFPEWVDRWTAIGLRTDPLSPEEWTAVEAAARKEYGYAGKPEPRLVLGVRSPLAAAIVVSVAKEVGPAARDHFGAGVWAGVRDGVGDGVGDGVRDGVRAGVRAGVWAGVRAGVGDGVGDGVRAGVRDGVPSSEELLAPFQEWLHAPILRGLERAKYEWSMQYQGGNLWCSWNAWATWFRDVGHLELKGDLWDRLEGDNTLMAAGPSWWYANLCVIADRPTVLHVEAADGINRLHCEDGPAIAWADGWGIYSWHGTQVPGDLIETGWDTTRILREENTEVRRCAIERLGWDRFVTEAELQQVGATVPDPGNPGQSLALYDVPERIYDERVRVLLCTNATPERDGTRHRFGLTVPGSIGDPIAAAAWTFGLNPSEYRLLERAS